MLLIFSGFNRRYKYISNLLLDKYRDSSIVIQKDFKGDYAGKYSEKSGYDVDTIKLFENHMRKRDQTEQTFYPEDKFNFNENTKYIYTTSAELNSDRIIDFIKKIKPSLVFVFGVGLLRSRILNCLGEVKIINLHFGLNPYYRGSNTLLWPLYHQCPGYLGITLHQIDSKIDHGPIYHQQITDFSKTDTIHEIFCKTIRQALKPTLTLVDLLINNVYIEPIRPKHTGKLFFNSEFTPNHLRIVYQLIDEGLLTKYLNNKSLFRKAEIFSVLNFGPK